MVGSNKGALRGGYIIDDCMSKPDIIIIASVFRSRLSSQSQRTIKRP